MKIIIEGDINVSYVQNLCLIFFPGQKFSEHEQESEETPRAYVKVERTSEGCRAQATLSYGEHRQTEEAFVPYSTIHSELRTAQIAVGAAVYGAGKKLVEFTPPWGKVTRIIPASAG